MLLICVSNFLPVSAQDPLSVYDAQHATISAPSHPAAPLARVMESPRTLIALQPELKAPSNVHRAPVMPEDIVSLNVLIGIYALSVTTITTLLILEKKKRRHHKR